MDPVTPNTIADPVVPTPEPVPAPAKSNSLVITLSALLLISLALTGFLFYQNQTLSNQIAQLQTSQAQPTLPPIYTQPSPVASSTPDPTANWKTYTNNTYGFNFKYPTSSTYKNTNFTGSKFGVTFNNLTQSANTDITIYIGSSWYFTNPKADSVKNFSIGGIQSYKEDLPLGQNPPQTTVYVKHNSDYIVIQLVKDDKDMLIDQTFNQILSTFKFTN